MTLRRSTSGYGDRDDGSGKSGMVIVIMRWVRKRKTKRRGGRKEVKEQEQEEE